MLQCDSKHFGSLAYAANDVIRFPLGVPGFEEHTGFLVIQRPDEFPLVYLQSLADPRVCFMALPILTVNPDYNLKLNNEDAALIGVSPTPRIGVEVLCLSLLAAHPGGPTANLLAPIVVNLSSRRACQCINATGEYPHRFELLPSHEGAAA